MLYFAYCMQQFKTACGFYCDSTVIVNRKLSTEDRKVIVNTKLSTEDSTVTVNTKISTEDSTVMVNAKVSTKDSTYFGILAERNTDTQQIYIVLLSKERNET